MYGKKLSSTVLLSTKVLLFIYLFRAIDGHVFARYTENVLYTKIIFFYVLRVSRLSLAISILGFCRAVLQRIPGRRTQAKCRRTDRVKMDKSVRSHISNNDSSMIADETGAAKKREIGTNLQRRDGKRIRGNVSPFFPPMKRNARAFAR